VTRMQISDVIASLALVVSLVSFWLSYRSARLTKLVAAAEKRTQAHSILVAVLLEAQDLQNVVRVGMNYKGDEFRVPEGLDSIESQLATMIESISGRLAWLRGKTSEDPLQLEEYKAYAMEVESRVRRLAPMVRELRVTRVNVE